MLWHFESPTGSVHRVEAEYAGRYRWRVSFTPDEAGSWRYYWTQEFLPEPYRSATGDFHVWGGCMGEVVRHLNLLEEEVAGTARTHRHRLYLRLYALEREGMRLMGPEDRDGTEGQGFEDAIRSVRSSLWGKPVPQPIPMQSHSLVREVDGVPLRDPIPEGSRYGPAGGDAGSRKKRKHSPLRRLRRAVARILRPRNGGPS